jgi:putative aldouronate transport system substrate-binding protein
VFSSNVNRRNFLAGAVVAGVALPLLNACAPGSAPGSSASSSGANTSSASGTPASGGQQLAGAQGASKSLFPTYIPVTNGPKSDYHDDNPLFSDGFDNYPKNPQKANDAAPGAGSTINILTAAYFPPPTAREQNPTWQAVEKQLNATMNMNIITGSDYRLKFPTIMAGDDLPDLMHIFFGYTLAPNLPDFFKAKCADLTPYLAGDAAKDYPYLAAIPTAAWKNSIAAVNGALYLIPIHRPMFSIPPYGGNFFKNVDMWDGELGQNYVPSSADDFKRALLQLTRPQQNQWGIGSFAGTGGQLFGIGCFLELFNAPNNWTLDSSGKLLKDRETDQYKAAVGYMRDLFAAGVYWPDTIQQTANVRPDFAGKRFAISPEGQGNSYVDFWQQGNKVTPPTRFGMLDLFPAEAGMKPGYFLGTGFVSMNVLKKNSPDKIKEILRIMNWLASPFGSQEDLLLTYGLEGQDYSLDDQGNPKPTTEGTARAGYVPWRYIAQHPWAYYQADLPGFAKASYDAEHASIPHGIDDPTNGYYSPLAYGKGVQADNTFYDGVRDIILSRRPMTDYDQLVTDWRTTAGEQIRKEYTDAMSASKG